MDVLYNRKFLVIGSGEMARQAMGHLYHHGFRSVTVYTEDAVNLPTFGFTNIPLQRLGEQYLQADIVILATHQMFDLPESVYRARQDKRRLVLDLGMPSSLDRRLGAMRGTALYTLNDLRDRLPSPLDALGGTVAAWRMVAQETQQMMDRLPTWTSPMTVSAAPVVKWMRRTAVINIPELFVSDVQSDDARYNVSHVMDFKNLDFQRLDN